MLMCAAIVAAGCGAYGEKYVDEQPVSNDSTIAKNQVTKDKFNADARKQAGCSDVMTLPEEGRGVADGKVTYKQNPPASGEHAKSGLVYGIFDTEQPTEKWLYNLEHGEIVITYKGMSAKQVADLKQAVNLAPYHVSLLPREANPKPGVYYTVWQNQIYCERPSKPALQEMIDEHLDKAQSAGAKDAAGGDSNKATRDS